MLKSRFVPATLIALGVVLLLAPAAWGQYTDNTIYTFTGSSDGSVPGSGNLVMDSSGNLYGTTKFGGDTGSANCGGDGGAMVSKNKHVRPEVPPAVTTGCGVVFMLTPAASGPWTETILYTFQGGNDGANPQAGVILDTAGNLYGTTTAGGSTTACASKGCGTVFKLTKADSAPWAESILYAFTGGTDGSSPEGGVVFDSTGTNLYGTTELGGITGTGCTGCGVVFELAPAVSGPWTETVLYSFGSATNSADGFFPLAGVTFDSSGNLYGTTDNGGTSFSGVVYKLTPAASGPWTESVLHSFSGSTDGANPSATVIFDASGNLYSTAVAGGNDADCGGSGCGVVFELTSAASGPWPESVLYTFTGLTDGGQPQSGVIFDSAGNLYGTTVGGGDDSGLVFELTPAASGPWTETVLYSFTGGADGSGPTAGVIADSARNLYGTTTNGGTNADGVVFELSPPPLLATTTTVASNINPSNFDETVTFTATVTATVPGVAGEHAWRSAAVSPAAPAPTGTVAFTANGVTITGCGAIAITSGTAQCPTAGLPVGTTPIVATYSGDTVYAGSASSPLSQVVEMAGTTTTVASGSNPSTFDQSVTFTATVAVQSTGVAGRNRSRFPQSLPQTPTGTVVFTANGTTITGCGAVTLTSSGTAQCTTSALPVGTSPIVATYSGDTNYAGSASSALSQVVDMAATTTMVVSSLNPSTLDQAVTFTATVSLDVPAGAGRYDSRFSRVLPQSPTGTVAFTSNGTTITSCGAVTLSSSGTAQCTTSTLPAGTDAIVATYSGDTNYSGSASSALSQVVNPLATTTSVVSSLNPSAFGQTVTFTATVAQEISSAQRSHDLRITLFSPQTPTGTVAFTSNGTTISGCSAVALGAAGTALCATSALPAGTDAIVATYSGDMNYSGSASSPLSQVVNMAATTTSVASSLNPSMFDQAVTVTATVVPGGDLFVHGHAGRIPRVSPQTPTGTVAFTSNGTTITGCSAVTLGSSGTAQCTTSALPVGTDPIVATYSGDSNYTGSASSSLSQVVNMAATATSVVSSLNPSMFDQAVTLTATVAVGSSDVKRGQYSRALAVSPQTPTGTVAFASNGTTITGCSAVTVSSSSTAQCTTSALPVGTDAIVATYSGDTNYTGSASSSLSQTVNLATTTTSVASSLNPSIFGQAVTFTSSVMSASAALTRGQVSRFALVLPQTPTGTVAFTSNGTTITGCAAVAFSSSGTAACTTSSLAVGTNTIVATYSGDSNYSGSSGTFSQVVNAAVEPQLDLTANPSSLSVVGGQQGSVALTVSSTGTVASTVTFTCSGLPSDASCAFSPSSIAGASLPASVTMTISTTTADARLRKPRNVSAALAYFAMMLPGLLLLPGGRRKIRQLRKKYCLLSGLALLLAVSLVGCCGTAGGGVVGTPTSKAYSVTVTASATGATAGTAPVALKVIQ